MVTLVAFKTHCTDFLKLQIKLTIEERFLLLETYLLAIENNYARRQCFLLSGLRWGVRRATRWCTNARKHKMCSIPNINSIIQCKFLFNSCLMFTSCTGAHLLRRHLKLTQTLKRQIICIEFKCSFTSTTWQIHSLVNKCFELVSKTKAITLAIQGWTSCFADKSLLANVYISWL